MENAVPEVLSILPLHCQIFFDVVDEDVKLSHGLVDSVLVHLQGKVRCVHVTVTGLWCAVTNPPSRTTSSSSAQSPGIPGLPPFNHHSLGSTTILWVPLLQDFL